MVTLFFYINHEGRGDFGTSLAEETKTTVNIFLMAAYVYNYLTLIYIYFKKVNTQSK